jgi:hypothetical protein
MYSSTRKRKTKGRTETQVKQDRIRWTMKKRASRVMSARLASIDLNKRASRMAFCCDTMVSRVCDKCNIRYIIGHKIKGVLPLDKE